MYDTIIIGAGSAGLMCAARLVYHGIDNILLADSNSKAGKKLAITGNGRCNLTNLSLDKDLYHTDDAALLKSILAEYPVSRALDFFEDELGLKTTDKDGLVYPFTMKSSSVIDVLRFYTGEDKIRYDLKIKSVKKDGDHFVVSSDKEEFTALKVVFATGGMSYPKTGSDGSGYKILASLVGKDKFTPVKPVLVQLKSSDRDIRALSGMRFNCKVTLVRNDSEVSSEDGEVLFTDYGISGICIMQLSRHLEQGKNRVIVDLLCDDELIRNNLLKFSDRQVKDALIGILPSILTEVVLKRIGTSELKSDRDIQKFIDMLHNFEVSISDTMGFDNAQVTRGGLKLSALDHYLESSDVRGLYACGEVIDVDGPCGGYNLQWAWSSAFAAADSIFEALRGGPHEI